MTMFASPVDDFSGNGMWSGGGPRPWWDFPTPLGVPKVQVPPANCFEERAIPAQGTSSPAFILAPVFCPGTPTGTVFKQGDTPWYTWFGSGNRYGG